MITSKHITESMMRSFCAHDLPALDSIVCGEHLEICSDCSEKYNQIKSQSLPRIFDFSVNLYSTNIHLDYEIIGEYIDSILDEEEVEMVETHLRYCYQCLGDITSLRDFRKSLELELKKRNRIMDYFYNLRFTFSEINSVKVIVLCSSAILLICFSLYQFIHTYKKHLNGNSNSSNPPIKIATQDTVGRETSISRSTLTPSQLISHKENIGTRKRFERIYDRENTYFVDRKNKILLGAERYPIELRRDIAKVLNNEDLGIASSVNDLASTEIHERGNRYNIMIPKLLSPIGTIIKEDRPTLIWQPIKGISRYIVKIVDAEFNPIIQSSSLETNQWITPKPLQRDKVYIWQVSAIDDNSSESIMSQPGRFIITSAKKLAYLEFVKKRYNSHLALGIVYFRNGLIQDAEKEISILVKQNPKSPFIRNLYIRLQMFLNQPSPNK